MNDSPLARYLVPLRRWWWIIAAILVVTIGVTMATLPDDVELTEQQLAEQATQFRATHILIRNDEASNQLSFELILLLSRQGDLTNRVVAATDGQVEAGDVESVQLAADPITETLTITAVQDSPDAAAELSNVYAEQLVSFLDERSEGSARTEFRQVTEQLDDIEARIDGIQDELATLDEFDRDRVLLQAELDGLVSEFSRLLSVEQALSSRVAGLAEGFVTLQEPSPVPVGEEEAVLALPANPVIRVGALTVLALILGIIVVLTIDYLDTRIRTRREAEEAFGLPVLAELPFRRKRDRDVQPLPSLSEPSGITAEVMRALTLSVELAPTWHLTSLTRSADGAVGTKTPVAPDKPPRTLVVTSALTGDGKSTLVANLAVSIAEGGKRVLVVDCDFRRPAVGALLDVDTGIGLRDLDGLDDLPMHELIASTAAPNVTMIRAGSKGITPPWFRGQIIDFVHRCQRQADVVIFDTGPITLTNEASALLPYMDSSLLVARAGKVATDQARGAIERLTQVGAHVSGVVLVGSEARRRYGYGYYTAAEGRQRRDRWASTTETPTLDEAEEPADQAGAEVSVSATDPRQNQDT